MQDIFNLEEIDEYDGVISDLTKKREELEGKENITEDEKKTLEEVKKDIEDFTQDRDELIKEEARLREEFDRFTDEIDEEISRQYEELTELTPNTDGYQEVVSKIEKLKVEQAAIIARKLTRDKSYPSKASSRANTSSLTPLTLLWVLKHPYAILLIFPICPMTTTALISLATQHSSANPI